MRSIKLIGPFLVIATALPCGAQATRTLGQPEVEFAEPFTRLVGVRELKDGRVVTADIRDKVIQLIDFKSRRMTKIGREGSGPKEFGLPMALIDLPGDSSAVYDPLNQRLLVINPDGTPGVFISSSGGGAGGGGGMAIRVGAPSFTDARGRMYSLAPNIRPTANGGMESSDSSAILRYDRAAGKTDTVGFVRTPSSNTQVSGGAGRMEFRMGVANPFLARDAWFVTPDGKVGVVRSPEYRIDWVYPQKSTGKAIAFSPIKVSEKHKQAWRDNRKNQTAIMMTNNNGQRSMSVGAPRVADMPDPTDWPDLMPPFLAASRLLVAPNGNVWVQRVTDANETRATYDVINPAGQVVERVVLPKQTTVIGFGNGTTYTVRTDEDDLQYLQRHRSK